MWMDGNLRHTVHTPFSANIMAEYDQFIKLKVLFIWLQPNPNCSDVGQVVIYGKLSNDLLFGGLRFWLGWRYV